MRRILAALLLLSCAAPAAAHDLRHTVTQENAVVLRLYYPDGTPFNFESYEIFRDGEADPYQVGHSDAQGRIPFLPDRAGRWRVKAFSADGHGIDTRITTDGRGALRDSERPFFERYARILVGSSLIFGLFGAASLFVRRKGR